MSAPAAYAEVAARLREEILSGQLRVGERLPTETELCERFGVSRSTVREALRTLSSRRMVTTTRGVHGGSAVARLGHEEATEMLQESIILLTQSEGATVDEILETRDLLEVPAARFAAIRRTPEQLELLRDTIPASLEEIELDRIFEVNRSFHDVLLATAGNRMLSVVTEPMFKVMQTRFLRDRADMGFWRQVMAEHGAIFAAIEAGDPDRAGAEMAQHLAHLRETYLSIDRDA